MLALLLGTFARFLTRLFPLLFLLLLRILALLMLTLALLPLLTLLPLLALPGTLWVCHSTLSFVTIIRRPAELLVLDRRYLDGGPTLFVSR